MVEENKTLQQEVALYHQQFESEMQKNEQLQQKLNLNEEEKYDKNQLLNIKIEILWNKKRKHRRETQREMQLKKILEEKLTKANGWQTRIKQIQLKINKINEVQFVHTIMRGIL